MSPHESTGADDLEFVDDPDLEAALDEADREPGEDADAVWPDLEAMIAAIERAVA